MNAMQTTVVNGIHAVVDAGETFIGESCGFPYRWHTTRRTTVAKKVTECKRAGLTVEVIRKDNGFYNLKITAQ